MTGEPLTEQDYNIQLSTVKLKRRVQMYQWVEETVENKFGETVATVQTEERTYYYTKDWRDQLIDSRSFYIRSGHHNPQSFPIESKVHVADQVFIGQFNLGQDIKNRITTFTELTSDTRPEDPSVKLHSGMYYHCNDVFEPEIGDIRIQFSFAGLQGEVYTIVGKLEKNQILPYDTSVDRKVLLVFQDDLNLEDAFKKEHYAQRLTTWSFRFFGWILLFFAATCLSTVIRSARKFFVKQEIDSVCWTCMSGQVYVGIPQDFLLDGSLQLSLQYKFEN
jgi:Transmembrane protein 43